MKHRDCRTVSLLCEAEQFPSRGPRMRKPLSNTEQKFPVAETGSVLCGEGETREPLGLQT